MKNIFKFGLFLIMSFVLVTNIRAATNPYSQTGSYGTNCTWYAWKMAYEKGKVTLPGWGNAKQWYNEAKNDGYKVGKAPKANSIVVWGNWTEFGHVGYVEKVEGKSIYVWDSTGPCLDKEDPEFIECMANSINEDTDKICYQNAKRIACEYDINDQDYVITGFIYLDEIPKKENTLSNNSSDKNEKPTVVTKSNNNNLSNIEISVGNINFDKNILEYNVEVLNDVDIITINATKEDEKATIEGIGEYELNVGLNEFKLLVTAEDNSKKEYIIKVTRKEPEVKEEIEEDKQEKIVENIEEANENNSKIKNYIMASLLIIISVVVLILILKKKRV